MVMSDISTLCVITQEKCYPHLRLYSKKLVKLQLGLLTIVNKAQFDLVYVRCGTYQTHTYQNLEHHSMHVGFMLY